MHTAFLERIKLYHSIDDIDKLVVDIEKTDLNKLQKTILETCIRIKRVLIDEAQPNISNNDVKLYINYCLHDVKSLKSLIYTLKKKTHSEQSWDNIIKYIFKKIENIGTYEDMLNQQMIEFKKKAYYKQNSFNKNNL
jgi:hypothetical protein